MGGESFPWHEVPKKAGKQGHLLRGRGMLARGTAESTALFLWNTPQGDSATGRGCCKHLQAFPLQVRPSGCKDPEPEVIWPTQQDDRPYRRILRGVAGGQAAISSTDLQGSDPRWDDIPAILRSVREISGGISIGFKDGVLSRSKGPIWDFSLKAGADYHHSRWNAVWQQRCSLLFRDHNSRVAGRFPHWRGRRRHLGIPPGASGRVT